MFEKYQVLTEVEQIIQAAVGYVTTTCA